jgi:hypothetical protein
MFAPQPTRATGRPQQHVVAVPPDVQVGRPSVGGPADCHGLVDDLLVPGRGALVEDAGLIGPAALAVRAAGGVGRVRIGADAERLGPGEELALGRGRRRVHRQGVAQLVEEAGVGGDVLRRAERFSERRGRRGRGGAGERAQGAEARLPADGGDVGDVGLVVHEEPPQQEDLRGGRLDAVGPGGQLAVPPRRVDHPGAGAASGRPRSDVGERLGPRAEELVREVAIGDLGQREHHRFGAQVKHGDRVHRVAVGRHDGPALRPGQIVLPEQPVDPDQAAEALQGAHRHDRGVTRHIRPGCQLDVGRLLARRAVGRCVAPAVPSPVPSPLEHADRASEPARSAAATRRAPDGPSPGRSERSERIMSTVP